MTQDPQQSGPNKIIDFSHPATKTWIGLAIFAVVLSALTAVFDYYPGDVTVARALQAISPGEHAWAETVTDTARVPGRYVLLALAVAVAWAAYTWRASLAGIVAFFTLIGFDLVGKPVFGRPRPSADLIDAPADQTGYSFPSTFAMVYVTTFGLAALALIMNPRGPVRIAGLAVCIIALLIGASARVVLAGHWPSDMVICYLIGFLWMTLLIRLTYFIPGSSPAPNESE